MAAIVRNGGSSTTWQVVRENVDQQLVQFATLLARNIVFRWLVSWDQLLHLLKSNLHACITAYVENRFIFSTFAEVEKSAQLQLMKRQRIDTETRDRGSWTDSWELPSNARLITARRRIAVKSTDVELCGHQEPLQPGPQVCMQWVLPAASAT